MRSANSRGARGAALLADAGIGRHEGGVEGALGEDGAEMVGQPQRDEKRVGHRPGAQHRRQDDVADEAGHARKQRKAADRQNAFDHRSAGSGETRDNGPTQRNDTCRSCDLPTNESRPDLAARAFEPSAAMPSPIIPILLAGGAGTRLWPVSRDALPKQFLPLVGERSTYQETLLRVRRSDVRARRSSSPGRISASSPAARPRRSASTPPW